MTVFASASVSARAASESVAPVVVTSSMIKQMVSGCIFSVTIIAVATFSSRCDRFAN